ncbi:MAG: SDR family oxidoreductase [Planctomycetota bacterium]|nr:SDR family oxidoreductase [Planctomycetota bacterium]
MILVIGATGTVGTHLVKGLRAQGVPLRVMTRTLDKASGLSAQGVEVVQGDLAQPETLDAALDGADRAFLLSALDPNQVELHGNFFSAAKKAGTSHVVRLSAIGARPDSPLTLGRWHGQVEKNLEESGVPFTHLKPHFFMQNLLFATETIRSQNSFFAPMGDAKIGAVDARDIAAVAEKVLTEDGHQGKTYDITGPANLSHEEMARILSSALGREVKFVDVPPDAAKQGMLDAGFPEWLADCLLELYGIYREGKGEMVTNVVSAITGKEPRSFEQFAKDHISAFQPA